MNPLTLKDLTHNAYRTLGLTAGATQAEIDSAARTMRLWDDAVPPTSNDAPLLGPVKRTKQDIESAVARLTDPERRVEERVWWFCDRPPESDAPLARAANAVQRHDAILAQLYRVLVTDADDASLPRWKALIAEVEPLASDDDYLAWLLDTEAAGDFEKRASLEEVAASQSQMAERLALALAAAAHGAMSGGDPSSARQAADLLTRTATPRAPASDSVDPAAKILDQLEDRLGECCARLRENIEKAWNSGLINILRPACHRAVNQFDATVKPILEELLAMAGEDADRRQRVREEVARLLAFISEGYEAVYDFISAERALLMTVPYAQETILEHSVAARLEIAKEAANRQRLGVPPKLRTRGLSGR